MSGTNRYFLIFGVTGVKTKKKASEGLLFPRWPFSAQLVGDWPIANERHFDVVPAMIWAQDNSHLCTEFVIQRKPCVRCFRFN